jgi:hypothetical protein
MSKFNFNSKIIEFNFQKEQLMKELAENARDFFVNKFDQEEWQKDKWQEAKDGHHPLLVKTGKLRSDLQNSIKDVTPDGYTIEVDNPYGVYHNEGTEHLPKRQFIGEDGELSKEQEQIIKTHVNRIFKH